MLLSYQLCIQLAIGQTECFTINFEDLAALNYREGDQISTEYLEEFGVRFELVGGGVPVIAQTGAPATAFFSSWGSDTGNPGVDIGDFFLTDDGTTNNGNNSRDIIIFFETPVNSVEGVILDLDSDERFFLEARNGEGDIISELNVFAGDPGTGDGTAAFWELIPIDCSTTIHSIILSGDRQASGAFGLGLDNLRFCYQGFDIRNDLDFDITDATCGENNGTISISNSSNNEYTFSIDNQDFSDQIFFENIPSGIHVIQAQDGLGCIVEFLISVIGIDLSDIPLQITNTSCGEENGELSLNLEPYGGLEAGISVALNDDEFISVDKIENLSAGDYVLSIQDWNECEYLFPFIIAPSFLPEIQDIAIQQEIICNKNEGVIAIDASSGTGNLSYSLDNINFSSQSLIAIPQEGEYTLFVKDDSDCTVSSPFEIWSSPEIEIDLTSTKASCLEEDGTIDLIASGGIGSFNFEWSDPSYNQSINLTELKPDTYGVTITDDAGCIEEHSVQVFSERCPVYVPNIINKNSDTNNQFIISIPSGYTAEIEYLRLYSRWGNLVYESKNHSFDCSDCWWKGKERNANLLEGVYIYHIGVLHPDGFLEVLLGNVTLIY